MTRYNNITRPLCDPHDLPAQNPGGLDPPILRIDAHGKREIRIGFVEEQCFQFGMKELWRDGKGRGWSDRPTPSAVEGNLKAHILKSS